MIFHLKEHDEIIIPKNNRITNGSTGIGSLMKFDFYCNGPKIFAIMTYLNVGKYLRHCKNKNSMYCKYCAKFYGSIANFFGTVSQIISIGPKNISTKFESSIIKCTILAFLKAYKPYYYWFVAIIWRNLSQHSPNVRIMHITKK